LPKLAAVLAEVLAAVLAVVLRRPVGMLEAWPLV